MKKVITMVGTSLFEDYLEKQNDTNFKNAYNDFKNNKIEAKGLDEETNRRINIEKGLNENYFKNNQNISAEIKSLIKLKEELKENFEIYLLYSDTALSRLAAEILQNALSCYYDEFKNCSIPSPKKIEGLQIWNRDEFNKGMVNLINTIENISKGYWRNIIINITGGYKATIPYLTLLAQINECPIYYIFEATDALIKIPYFPIDIKWDIFRQFWDFFEKIAHPNSINRNELNENVIKNCISLLTEEKIDNKLYISLNPLGEILWRRYKSGFFIFYAPEEIYREIQGQSNIKRILIDKFCKSEKRKNKTEVKNGHYVYDEGDNPYRIFYFEKEGKIYIYKTFENHNEYEDYLGKVRFDKNFIEQIKNQSKIYKEEVKK